jgi:hypothetical protein
MLLLLQGAHYTLAIPEEVIKEKYTMEEDDGYKAEEEAEEEEDDNSANNEVKSTEDKLRDIETKYGELKGEYTKILDKFKSLEAQLKKERRKNIDTNPDSETDDNVMEAEELAKSKSNGFRKTNPQSQSEVNLVCTVCKEVSKSSSKLKRHMLGHTKDGDWTCGDNECSYQTISEADLKEHMRKAHTKKSQSDPRQEVDPRKGANTCNICDKDYVYKIDLNKHIRETHKSYKTCRNLKSCTYAPKCRYDHTEHPEGTQVCYECGKTFKTLHELMKHRKADHRVRLCKEFLKGNCGFSAEDCYNSHAKQSQHTPAPNVANKSKQSLSKPQGFWDHPSNLAPPAQAQVQTLRNPNGPTHSEWTRMKEQINQLNQMMQKFL